MRRYQNAKLFIILLFIILAIVLILQNPLSESVTISGSVASNEVGEHNEDPDVMQLWFQALLFDPISRTAKFNLYAWTNNDDQHFSSSMISPMDYWLFVDELYGEGNYQFRKDERVGAVAFDVDVLSIPMRESRPNDFYYPYDSYVLDAYAGVSLTKLTQGRSNGLGDKGIPAFEYFYETSLPGFNVTYTRIAGWSNYDTSEELSASEILAERDSGQISFLAIFDRSIAIKISVFFIISVWIINTSSLVWISQRVLTRKRPPSIEMLVWSAASTLGYVQLRVSLPSSPRLGIAIDYLFYFPSLLASVVVALLITVAWSTRNDFSR